VRALLFARELGDALLAGRTERSVRAAGMEVQPKVVASDGELAALLAATGEPLLIVRSGAWLAGPITTATDRAEERGARWLRFAPWKLVIPRSGTGLPLIASGRERAWTFSGRAAAKHAGDAFLRRAGGDLDRAAASWWWRWSRIAEPMSCYLEPACAQAMARRLGEGMSLAEATKTIIGDKRFRAVHIADLDVHHDLSLRIIELVTSLQIGGAERVVLDLAEELNSRGNTAVVATSGVAARTSFAAPRWFCDLSHVPHAPEARAEAVERLANAIGADVVHAHLIQGADARAIRARNIPLVVSMHNLPPSWPAGFGRHDPQRCDLLLACAQEVERAVDEADLGAPVRTVWNGIDASRFAPAPSTRMHAAQLRARLGWHESDFVIVAVANPRKQKRLERLPEIVRRVADQLAPVRVRLLWAGDTRAVNADAAEALRRLHAQMAMWLDPADVHCAGGCEDVRVVLAAADVFVSVSAYEGLSVAQLEALAAGLPVVTTAVGGAPEVARCSAEMTLLNENASAMDFARTLCRLHGRRALRQTALPHAFTRHAMARRTAQLHAAAIVRTRRTANHSIWLVTNNFSTGGAQSSARRLLVGLRQRGLDVCAFTIQEQPRWPTPGRRALVDAGVACVPIAPPKNLDPGEAIARFLEHAAWKPPRTVFFWNVIASYKVLLADALLDTAIYDVSPGEMFFSSLASFFARQPGDVSCANAHAYGKRLAGVVVKYRAEELRAASVLGTAVHVIPNGVPLRAAAQRSDARMIVFGTAARLSPDKRLEDLLAALRVAAPKLPPHVLRIAGGPEHGPARAYANELRRAARGLRTEWLGELTDLTAFYDSIDVFVMIAEPAGCPNASLEAMAAGVPVIATDHGGAGEQIIDRVTGRLVARFDVAALADAMVELAHAPALRAACATRAREHVRAHFSLERMIDRYAYLSVGIAVDDAKRRIDRCADRMVAAE
jgi:glycosyltransferase involved in cell wall biosynthesis